MENHLYIRNRNRNTKMEAIFQINAPIISKLESRYENTDSLLEQLT